MTLLVVEKSDPLAWGLMPMLCERIRAFCTKYDSDAKPETFIQQLQTSFVLREPGIIGMLLLDGNVNVTGHIVVSLEEWMGTRMATILQLESDEPLTEELVRAPLEWFEWWAIANKAEHFQCFARNQAAARLFERKYGFQNMRVLMRKKLQPVAAVEGAA